MKFTRRRYEWNDMAHAWFVGYVAGMAFTCIAALLWEMR